jgi:hypothetical protein
MNRFHHLLICCLASLASLAACGGTNGDDGSDVDTSNHDPRCVAACPETMPLDPNIGAVCDSASRGQCLDECEARIAGEPTICQSCLLENADFRPDAGGVDSVACDNTSCTIMSSFGTCSYPPDDQAAQLACEQKLDPHRVVACTVRFQSTTKCATVCP